MTISKSTTLAALAGALMLVGSSLAMTGAAEARPHGGGHHMRHGGFHHGMHHHRHFGYRHYRHGWGHRYVGYYGWPRCRWVHGYGGTVRVCPMGY